jgi:Putative Ig domain
MTWRRVSLALMAGATTVALMPAVAAAQDEIYISNPQPPEAVLGQTYSYQLQVAGENGYVAAQPVSFGTTGPLPEGLSLSSSGLISGTPDLPQTAEFYVTFADSNDGYGNATIDMTVGSGTASLDPTLIPIGNEVISAEASAQSAENNVEGEVNNAVADAEGLGGSALCAVNPSCTDHLK